MASQGRISVNRNVPEATLGNDHCTEQPDMRNMAFTLFHHKTAMSATTGNRLGSYFRKRTKNDQRLFIKNPLPARLNSSSRTSEIVEVAT